MLAETAASKGCLTQESTIRFCNAMDPGWICANSDASLVASCERATGARHLVTESPPLGQLGVDSATGRGQTTGSPRPMM